MRTLFAMVLTGFLLGANRETVAIGTSQVACEGLIDGRAYPFLVPAHLTWKALWNRADAAKNSAARASLSRELQVSDAVVESVLAAATTRRSPLGVRTARPRNPLTEQADLEIDARDRLRRSLSPEDAARVEEWVANNSDQFHRLGVAGRAVTDPSGRVLCRVSVNGNVNPHLIPEHEYWGVYFQFLARTANLKATEDGRWGQEFIRALQETQLPLSEDQLVALVGVAVATDKKLQQLRVISNPNVDHQARVAEMRDVVIDARTRLLMSLDPKSWQVLLRDVHRVRRGTVFDFPGFSH